MKNSFYLIRFITSSTIIYSVISHEKLTAVSKFEGMENLHTQLQTRRIYSKPKGEILNTLTMYRICKGIFDSGYFKKSRVTLVNFFKLIFYHIIYHVSFKNKLRLINVHNTYAGQTITENVFLCLAETKPPSDFKLVSYFVSEEFDVNDPFDSESYTAGRFVFVYKYSKFYYEALAEQPATMLSRFKYHVERLYLDLKKDHKTAETVSEDPLCKLDMSMKLRICGLVLSSSYFRQNNVYFLPERHYVWELCKKRKISFRTTAANARAADTDSEERMIVCQAKRRHEFAFFYVARGYGANRVFVYTYDTTNEKMFIEGLSINVRGYVDSET